MTNNLVGFDVGGVKGVIDTNTSIKRLKFSSTSTAAESYESLVDFATGVSYVVPASKKARIIYFVNYAPVNITGTFLGKLIYADDENGGTNPVTLFTPYSQTAVTNFIFITASVPTGKYINFGRSAAAGTKEVDCYAIEEAA